MSIRHALGSVRWKILSAVHRREFKLPDIGPTVSFTFDDFPRSAYTVGGTILKSYGVCGTYYAAMGLMDQVNEMGQQFCAEDLTGLLQDGHELGSHTFSHLSCRSASVSAFHADMKRGRQALEEITGLRDVSHFSYPYGHATLLGKNRMTIDATSCRGVVPGINRSPADLNLLRANNLYSWSFNLGLVNSLLKINEERRGWLIFYTHDISERPSRFGCKPDEFESVVKRAVSGRARILPIGSVVANRRLQSAESKLLGVR
jgi:peptidoglycan/xylan/chitin deacetylase (PgdA/CDA1 family)